MENEIKAHDVVWIFDDSRWMGVTNYSETKVVASSVTAYDTQIHERMNSYTLTTIAEENTRKVVRGILESIIPMVDPSDKMLDKYIDKLLSECQDTKEVSDETTL